MDGNMDPKETPLLLGGFVIVWDFQVSFRGLLKYLYDLGWLFWVETFRFSTRRKPETLLESKRKIMENHPTSTRIPESTSLEFHQDKITIFSISPIEPRTLPNQLLQRLLKFRRAQLTCKQISLDVKPLVFKLPESLRNVSKYREIKEFVWIQKLSSSFWSLDVLICSLALLFQAPERFWVSAVSHESK